MMKTVFALSLLFTSLAFADVLTLGIANVPTYVGSRSHRNVPMILFYKSWDDYLVELDGANLITHYRQSKTFSYGLVTRINLERDPISGAGINTTDRTALDLSFDIGLSSRITLPNLNLSDEDKFTLNPMLQFNTLAPGTATTARLNLAYYTKLFAFLRLSTELEYRWSNSSYQNYFFGIDSETSADSGLAAYSPHSGSQAAFLRESIVFAFAERWGLIGSATWSQILGPAKESPFVKGIGSAHQTTLALGVYYYWP